MKIGQVLSAGIRIAALSVMVFGLTMLRTGEEAWSQAEATDPPAPPPGVEVMARGPVHEAFAEPAGGQVKASPAVPKAPPEPIEEVPPDQKPAGDNVQWLPGYWAWDDEKADYLWISGFWRVPPPGRQWMPGRWHQVDSGWQWVPGLWTGAETRELNYLPPPPDPLETGPSVPAPDLDHVYVRGSWVYRDGRYIWRPGYWCAMRPGWVWVPSHYAWTPSGYLYVDGYWDYTLRDRGMLFAPVSIDVTVCRRPGWFYSPCYVVHDECLVRAMFVRPGYGCYYFGDYFEPCHRSAGYVAWCDVRVGGCYGDPLYSTYYVHHRSEPTWSISIGATYVGRYNGTVARPPRTLIQQNTVVNNVTVNNITNVNNTTVNKNVTVNNVQNNTMLTSINQVNKTGVAMKPVSPEERKTATTTAKQLTQAGVQRGQQETQLLKQGPPPSKPTDAPRVAKVELPKVQGVPAAAVNKAPPAAAAKSGPVSDPKIVPVGARSDVKTPQAVGNNPAPGTPGVNKLPQPGAQAVGKNPAAVPQGANKLPQPGPQPGQVQKGPQPLPKAAAQPKHVPPPPAKDNKKDKDRERKGQ